MSRSAGPLDRALGQRAVPGMGMGDILTPDNNGGLAGLIDEQRRYRGLQSLQPPQLLAPDVATMQNALQFR